MEAKSVRRGDPCPNCGGELKVAPFPEKEQYDAAHDRENPITLPAHFDTATIAQRRELGELARCACGYITRYGSEETPRRRSRTEPEAQ